LDKKTFEFIASIEIPGLDETWEERRTERIPHLYRL
jgi:hypothetical protein